MKQILGIILIILTLVLVSYFGYTNRFGVFRAKEPESSMVDSLYRQGIRLELRQQIISAKLDTIILLQRINLNYTDLVYYNIDSLINTIQK